MNKQLKDISEELKQLACKECTKGWLEKHNKLTDPIDDIQNCFNNGLISIQLKQRLIKEVEEIINQV